MSITLLPKSNVKLKSLVQGSVVLLRQGSYTQSPRCGPFYLQAEANPDEERDSHGRWTKSGDSGPAKTAPAQLSKSDIAKLSYRGGNAYEQKIADETEKQLSSALGIPRTGNNSPFDLQSGKIGIEVKTFISNSNGKVTMKADAMERKAYESSASKLKKTFTVVADRRSYNSNGKITGVAGPVKLYVRDGWGSFRLNTMREVGSPQELKAYIAKKGTGKFSL